MAALVTAERILQFATSDSPPAPSHSRRYKSGEISSGAAWLPKAGDPDPSVLRHIEAETEKIHATPYTQGVGLQIYTPAPRDQTFTKHHSLYKEPARA